MAPKVVTRAGTTTGSWSDFWESSCSMFKATTSFTFPFWSSFFFFVSFFSFSFFPACQVRVVRFYVSVLLLFLFSSSSSSSSSSYCDDVCVAMMCVPDHHCDHARSVWCAGPQPRSCAVSVACRTSTAIM